MTCFFRFASLKFQAVRQPGWLGKSPQINWPANAKMAIAPVPLTTRISASGGTPKKKLEPKHNCENLCPPKNWSSEKKQTRISHCFNKSWFRGHNVWNGPALKTPEGVASLKKRRLDRLELFHFSKFWACLILSPKSQQMFGGWMTSQMRHTQPFYGCKTHKIEGDGDLQLSQTPSQAK